MTHEEALRKAMACLRLAKSSNAAEAGLAAAKAQEIIDRYNLNIDDADYAAQDAAKDNEDIKYFGDDPVDTVLKRDRGWTIRLLSVVSRANCCRPLLHTNIDGKGGNRYMVVGRPSDVQTVRYIYSYFKTEVARLRDENTKGNSGTYKNQYCAGVVDAISQKLRDQKAATRESLRAEHKNNPMALVKINNAIAKQDARREAVEKFMNDPERIGFKLGHCGGNRGTGSHTGGREQGRRDGQSIRLTSAKAGLGRGVAGHIN